MISFGWINRCPSLAYFDTTYFCQSMPHVQEERKTKNNHESDDYFQNIYYDVIFVTFYSSEHH